MGKALKNIGFFLVTIILTAAIFWLVFIDKESKQDVLEYSLGLLGQKLMAMMPDSSNTKPVQALYEDFVEKARKKEVPPEKIENVAATILNLSNIDTVVTPKEMEAIIKFSLAEPIKIERVYPDSVSVDVTKRVPEFVAIAPPTPKPGKKLSTEEWSVLGERIKSAYKFNTEYQKAMKDYQKNRHEQQFQMQFKVDDGLRIAMDANLKQQLDQKKYQHLQKEMQELEKQRIIVWRKNFQEEMRKEMEQRRQELESLKQLKELKGLEALQSLESLKSLEALQYIPVVNPDSIRIIVEKSLKAAGVHVDVEKKK
jgi:hypothetical protein